MKMLPSFFDKGAVRVDALGLIASGATHADVLIPFLNAQRIVIILAGAGPDPVGNIEVVFKAKVGAAAAAALATDTIVRYATGVPGLAFTAWNMTRLLSGGKIVIPAASVTAAFQWGFLFDCPVLALDAQQDDLVDQIAVSVKNAGTTGSTLSLITLLEEPRY